MKKQKKSSVDFSSSESRAETLKLKGGTPYFYIENLRPSR